MSLLNIFSAVAGDTVTLRMQPNQNVMTYVVFVRRWTAEGSLPVTSWLPSVLQSPAGASLILQPGLGYDLILKAVIRKGTGVKASIVPNLQISNGDSHTQPINLPQSEAPGVERYWSILI